MANFNVPSSPTTYESNLGGFLGVDFSSSISDIDKRRTPYGVNFINKNGTIEKRNGYKVLAYLGEKANINGIWNVDTVNGEFFVVHCGTKLYEMQINFSSYTEILTGLADKISQGTVIGSKLLILDGKRAVVYDLLKTTNKVSYLDTIGYIPTTQIARSPNGLLSQKYEDVNLVQNSRINLFTSTETDTTYQLDDIEITSIDKVEVLSDSGEWTTKATSTYTVNLSSGQVVFNTAIGKSPVDGRDNVRIKYTKVIDENKSQVNKCDIMCVYGYAGANNRIFMAGNPDYPNIITYSHIDDITYIPVNNIIKTGLEVIPITALVKTNDGKMSALKDVSDSDSTIFYIGYGTFNGNEVFSIEGSTKGEGNIAKNAHATLINEPLILTQNGIFALNTGTITDERYVYHRSYYIDSKLKKENNLKDAVGITNDGKYYLAINDNVYVADSRFKTTNINSKYSNYQYEWYFWSNLPVRVWFVRNNVLYFGDKSGNLCVFRDDVDENRFKDIDSNVVAEWNSIILDLNRPAHKKNIKRVSIATEAPSSKLTIGYKLKNGTKQVLAKEYNNSSFPKTIMIRKKAKKLSFFSLYLENNENSNMSFNSICVVYTVGSYYKGD
ncbi:MAG: hypothetical protein ACI4UU_00525 [Clostridia bacterium]